jgi:hypothetical protein
METIAYAVGGTVTELSFTALGVGANPRVTYGTHGASKFSLPLPGVPPPGPAAPSSLPAAARTTPATSPAPASAASW